MTKDHCDRENCTVYPKYTVTSSGFGNTWHVCGRHVTWVVDLVAEQGGTPLKIEHYTGKAYVT